MKAFTDIFIQRPVRSYVATERVRGAMWLYSYIFAAGLISRLFRAQGH